MASRPNASESMEHEGELVKLTSDYVQMFINAVCFLLGMPFNLATFRKLFAKYRRTENRMLLLHVNLNLSDIFVLVFYCLGRFLWVLTYEWKGGQILCVLMRFMEQFSFAISSNVMVCIAIDRVYALFKPLQAPLFSMKFVPLMLMVAWALALLTSAPQLFVWEVLTAQDPYTGEAFTQCLSSWVVAAMEQNRSEPMAVDYVIYEIYHLLTLFWIPVAILLTAYTMIVVKMCRASRNDSLCEKMESEVKFDPDHSHKIVLRRMTGGRQVAQVRLRTIRVTLLLMAVYILCWLPYNSLAWWSIVANESYREYEDTFYVFHGLILINSVVNPFIYRKHSLSFFKCFRRKTGAEFQAPSTGHHKTCETNASLRRPCEANANRNCNSDL